MNPPPLDLAPIRFETPIAQLDAPVVVETEDGATVVIEVVARRADGVRLRLSSQTAADPEYVDDVPGALELGEFTLRHVPRRPVRAFALPPGTMQARHQLRVLAVASLSGLAALGLITLVLISGLPGPMQAFLTVALVVLAVGIVVVPARIRPAVRHLYRTANGAVYPLDRILDSRPAGKAALELVDSVKEQYGALLSDICYRIECPALFDPADSAAKRLTTALIRWDERRDSLDPSELGAAAAEVKVAFDAARANAEALGMAYLPEMARPDALTALKAAKLAQSTDSPAERATALRQVGSLLAGLALYYLPSPAEATLMLEGRPVLALPGRMARDVER